MCEFNKRLQELAYNAKEALQDLANYIIAYKEINWKPAWGLTLGCLDQLDDIVEEAWEEE